MPAGEKGEAVRIKFRTPGVYTGESGGKVQSEEKGSLSTCPSCFARLPSAQSTYTSLPSLPSPPPPPPSPAAPLPSLVLSRAALSSRPHARRPLQPTQDPLVCLCRRPIPEEDRSAQAERRRPRQVGLLHLSDPQKGLSLSLRDPPRHPPDAHPPSAPFFALSFSLFATPPRHIRPPEMRRAAQRRRGLPDLRPPQTAVSRLWREAARLDASESPPPGPRTQGHRSPTDLF